MAAAKVHAPADFFHHIFHGSVWQKPWETPPCLVHPMSGLVPDTPSPVRPLLLTNWKWLTCLSAFPLLCRHQFFWVMFSFIWAELGEPTIWQVVTYPQSLTSSLFLGWAAAVRYMLEKPSSSKHHIVFPRCSDDYGHIRPSRLLSAWAEQGILNPTQGSATWSLVQLLSSPPASWHKGSGQWLLQGAVYRAEEACLGEILNFSRDWSQGG